MATEAELRGRGRMGFSEEDYAEWLRRKIERREDIQAHEMALERLRETGAGERLGRTIEAARPGEEAAAERARAETAEAKFETRFKEKHEGLLGEMMGLGLKAKRLGVKERGLGIEALEKELGLGRAPGVAAPPTAPPSPAAAPTVARPKRKVRPGVEKFLWSGYPERGLPGVGAPLKGWLDISNLLGKALRKGYEWAFPMGK